MAERRPQGLRHRLDAVRERLADRRRELEAESDAELTSMLPPPPTSAATPGEVRVVVEPTERDYRADQGHPVPYAVRAAADWSWRVLVIAGAITLVGYLAWEFRVVVFPIFAALLLAAGLSGHVRRLRRLGWNRAWSAVAVFLVFVVVVAGSLTLVGNLVGDQFGDVVDQAREGLQEIRDWLAGPPFRLDEEQLEQWATTLTSFVQDNQSDITEGAAAAAGIAFEILIGIVLTLFALVFMLYDGDRIWAWLTRLLPASARNRATSAGAAAWQTLGQYVRGIVVVAVFDAVGIIVVLLVLGVPLAVPLGVLVFFGAFVPLVGAFVTGALAMLVALVTQGLLAAIIVLIGNVVIQQLEGHVFQPLILGRMVRIHPLAVIVAVAIGSLAGGIIGAVVAVPFVAVLNAVVSHLTAAPVAVPGAGPGAPPAPPPPSHPG